MDNNNFTQPNNTNQGGYNNPNMNNNNQGNPYPNLDNNMINNQVNQGNQLNQGNQGGYYNSNINNQGGQGGYNNQNMNSIVNNNQGGQDMNLNSNNQEQLVNQVMNKVRTELEICNDPVVMLAESEIAYVRQKVELLEVMTGCDTLNQYSVYSRNSRGNVVHLFECKEDSGCCERVYCRGDSKPFKMLMKHVTQPGMMEADFMNTYAVFDRPFKCTCCCLGRPSLSGYYKDMNGNNFGRIEEPWTCCDPVFIIKDQNKDARFQIHANCCQCGLICRNSLGKCSETVFNIFPLECTNFDDNNAIGTIKKVSGGFMKEFFTEADNYEVKFPPNASPEEKLLIVGATLMIDYRFFEDTQKKDNIEL